MKKKFKKNQSGFTLIEMLVSVAIFVIVAVVVTGALMVVIQSYRKAQTAKLVIDNLNFTIDQITLDLREGTEYRGINSDYSECFNDCPTILFRSRNGRHAIYSWMDNGVDQRVWVNRDCDADGTNCASSFGMTDQQVSIIKPAGSRGLDFRFTPPLNDTAFTGHRKIIISLNGEVVKGGEKTLYHLQSTVSQRNL